MKKLSEHDRHEIKLFKQYVSDAKFMSQHELFKKHRDYVKASDELIEKARERCLKCCRCGKFDADMTDGNRVESFDMGGKKPFCICLDCSNVEANAAKSSAFVTGGTGL